ncbi:MAG: hypothetical protein NT121_00850 [Chloroflexi bacterium]|nr:hypothetical protein [Chloroflexota bacterium]
MTITTTNEIKEGDQVQLGASSGSASSSKSNSANQGGGIPIPGVGGPPGG